MSKPSSVARTIRLSQEVADAADAWCSANGSSFSDLGERALREFLEMRTGAIHELLDEIIRNARTAYGQTGTFPPDVTLRAMHRVKGEPTLYALYEQALDEQTGADERQKRQQLHARIAKAIKKTLGAENGRVVMGLDHKVDLVQGFTELLPG